MEEVFFRINLILPEREINNIFKDDFQFNTFTGNLELLQVDGVMLVYTKDVEFIKRFSAGSDVRSVLFFEVVLEDIIVLFSEYTENRL
ncbi:MAG: hypothetical protein AAF693_00625 [Bacteroidota bacterium]